MLIGIFGFSHCYRGDFKVKVLHELLATERNFVTQSNKIFLEVTQKFDKEHFFKGFTKSLKMLKDDPNNASIEQAGSERKELTTTVKQTLSYLMDYWTKAEDIQATKNETNRHAIADVEVNGQVVLTGIPVDELMGLESRLMELRKLFEKMPTLDASKSWTPSQIADGAWEAVNEDVTTKTEKVVTVVVLYEATKEHPAQVKEMSKDEVVGTYTMKHFSGAVTSLQKAQCLERVDSLLVAVKMARMRANGINIVKKNVGELLAQYLLKPLM